MQIKISERLDTSFFFMCALHRHYLDIESPLLSNSMLNELDEELETRGLRFVRSEKVANPVRHTTTRFIVP